MPLSHAAIDWRIASPLLYCPFSRHGKNVAVDRNWQEPRALEELFVREDSLLRFSLLLFLIPCDFFWDSLNKSAKWNKNFFFFF